MPANKAGMKPSIAIPLGVAGILAAIGTTIANANGLFAGHPSLAYWFWGGSLAILVIAVAGWLFRPREQATKALPSVHQGNKPEIHIENKPVFENKPTIIISTGAAAPAPESERAYSEVLAFLERTMQRGRAVTYFVENIATATHLPEQQIFNALQRLVEEEHAFRSPIEGVGTDGRSTRWGHVYWYAHF